MRFVECQQGDSQEFATGEQKRGLTISVYRLPILVNEVVVCLRRREL